MTQIRLPAEWEPQDAIMLTWPHAQTDWAEDLPAVESTFLAIAELVCRYQKLLISCQSFEQLEAIADTLHQRHIDPAQVGLFCVPSNDSWARDHGPITIYGGDEPLLLDFQFNAWGGKFLFEKDNQITPTLFELGAFEGAGIRHVDYILEGGSIETDGVGTLLTTSTCLLSHTRNPDADKNKVAKKLADWLGIKRILWLDHGHLIGDDTDAHIDTLARFCSPDTLCYVKCENPDDPHFADLAAMERQLQAFTDLEGEPYNLIALPMAEKYSDRDQRRLPATYANFLIIDNAVLVPAYNLPSDEIALQRLAACFPDRKLHPVDCTALIEQHGSLHCVTMQLPEGVL